MENRGGKRKGAGRKGVPYKLRAYRVPLEFLEECSDEIKAVLKKYRKQCKTSK